MLNPREILQFTNEGDDKYIIKSLTDSLLQSDIKYFHNSCLSSPKLRTYVNIVDFSQENIYLYKPLKLSQKLHLAKFKVGILPIRIESSHYCYPILPENERICLQCSSNNNYVENEINFALHCQKHAFLRETLFNRIGQPADILTDPNILKIMITSPQIVKIFAQFISDCYSNRTH